MFIALVLLVLLLVLIDRRVTSDPKMMRAYVLGKMEYDSWYVNEATFMDKLKGWLLTLLLLAVILGLAVYGARALILHHALLATH